MEPHYPYLPREENGRRFWRHAGVDRAAAAARFVGEIDAHFGNRKRLAWSARETEYAVDLYDAAVADLDAAIARLLGAIGAKTLADTAIVITSDHGEEFGDHGGFQHAHALFDELIRVPLILLLPEGRLPPGRNHDIVQLTDVAPTLLDLADAGAGASDMAGHSLLEPDARRSGTAAALLGVRFLRIHTLAFIRGFEKLIVGTEPDSVSLFDLGADPHERRDLAAAKPERAAALRQELDRHPILGSPSVPVPRPTAAVDPAVRERLRGLGYNF
jgi:arylsulfatase A-like enzyme